MDLGQCRQNFGVAYISRVDIPSLRSEKGNYLRNYPSHDYHPVEQDANRRAFLYFNKHVKGFQNDVDRADNLGWNFNENPLDVYGSGTGEYIDYQDKSRLFTPIK